MTLRKGDRGALVTQLQATLLELGYQLPRYGADGDAGDETLEAVGRLLADHGRARADDPDPTTVNDVELAFVYDLAALLRKPADVAMPLGCIDRRPQAAVALRARGYVYGMRPWTQVTGVTLHQTACWLSDSKDPARCDAIGAHFVVYPDGSWFWNHDVNVMIVHGNGLNTRTYGIEIDGNFEGVDGKHETLWKGGGRRGQITAAQVATTKAIVCWQGAVIAAHGGAQKVVLPHRVASRDRQDDPGSLAWQLCGIALRDELGLDDGGPGFALHDSAGGMPIPEAWDPSRVGVPY